jgi:hypothetical protein
MREKIMTEYKNINVFDVSFCLQDDDGNTLEDKNGNPKLFRYKGDINAPFDYIQTITEGTELSMLEEIK